MMTNYVFSEPSFAGRTVWLAMSVCQALSEREEALGSLTGDTNKT